MISFTTKIKRKWYKLFHPSLGEILMLHRVVNIRSTLEDNRRIEVTPAFLEQTILRYKNQGYRFVSLGDIYEQIVRTGKKTRKFVCFTFDDGYVDNYKIAFPIFKKYNCPFSIFVTTDFPDRKALLWWYVLEDILLENNQVVLGDGSKYDCSTIDLKNNVFREIRDKIFSLQSNDMLTTLSQLFVNYQFSFENKVDNLALNWEQLKSLSEDSLCTIASHTVSHPALTKLSKKEILEELNVSKEKIEIGLRKKVNYFAYPYGIYNDKVINLVQNAGYSMAILANGGLVRKGDSVLELKRNNLTEQL